MPSGETGIDVVAAARDVAGQHLGAVLVSGDASSTLRDVRATDRWRIASKPILKRRVCSSNTPGVRAVIDHLIWIDPQPWGEAEADYSGRFR